MKIKKFNFKFYVLSSLVFASLLLISPMLKAEVQLNFGVYTSDKPSEMVKAFRPILNVIEQGLSERMGDQVTVKLQIAKNYEEGINDLISGKVDFARFGPASYILAKQEDPEIKVIAIESKKGKKRFNGIICVNENSSTQKVEELKGKSFAFGNESSTIGRYLSQNYLFDHDIKAKDLTSYVYLGRHDTVGTAVAAGLYDAGALKEGTFKKLVSKGAPLRSIATFPNVTKPWIARGGLDEKTFVAIKDVLLEMNDEMALKALKKDGFVDGNDDDYIFVRKAMEQNSRFFE
jgi:phosphonate transport system substrate-binding protein